MLLKKSLYFIILLFLFGFCSCKKNNRYNGGLIFYDPITKYKILPPIVTSIRFLNLSRTTLVRQPCACRQNACGCCAGLNLPQFNFNHLMCADISFVPEELNLKLELLMDGQALMMYNISPRNPPPFCIPVPLPIPVGMCLRLYDIKLIGNNIHSCMDWILRVFNKDAMVLHFACINIGQDGIHVSRPGSPEPGTPDQEAADIFDPVEMNRRCYI